MVVLKMPIIHNLWNSTQYGGWSVKFPNESWASIVRIWEFQRSINLC